MNGICESPPTQGRTVEPREAAVVSLLDESPFGDTRRANLRQFRQLNPHTVPAEPLVYTEAEAREAIARARHQAAQHFGAAARATEAQWRKRLAQQEAYQRRLETIIFNIARNDAEGLLGGFADDVRAIETAIECLPVDDDDHTTCHLAAVVCHLADTLPGAARALRKVAEFTDLISGRAG